MAGRELLDQVRSRLTDEERLLADRRGEGRPWDGIAAELGGTAESRRKQLARRWIASPGNWDWIMVISMTEFRSRIPEDRPTEFDPT